MDYLQHDEVHSDEAFGDIEERCMPKLILPLSPGTNRMWRRSKTGVYPLAEYVYFKTHTYQEALISGVCHPLQGPVMVGLTYHPKARKKETDKPLKRMDVDAHIKPVLDALIGVAYEDDYQVTKVWSELGEPIDGGQLVVEWEAA